MSIIDNIILVSIALKESSGKKLYACGTHVGTWLKGGHPMNPGETVERSICFSKSCSETNSKMDIALTNCINYFVYNLTNVKYCYLRYCTQWVEVMTKYLLMKCLIIGYLSRFFDCWAHETTYAYIGNKHFFTKSCHPQTYQNSKISWQKICSILLNKVI